ncbi:c-type cytochrome [Hydrogenivirga sp.]
MKILLLLIFALLLSSCEREESHAPKVSVKELVGIRGCPYCHDMRRQLLGPPFIEISRRYNERDIGALVNSILKGSRGKWGENSMPPQKVSREEAELIVRWILSLKDDLR